MRKILKIVIWIAILACFLRGLFVFDMGGSAENSYPTASAICFTASIFFAILMLKLNKE